MRIGIFGGSFDPVHYGHLWIAEMALEQLELDEIRWIPAAQSPLKPGGAIAKSEDRLRMLSLATAGATGHVVDDREIRRGEVSYTIDTVNELLQESPDAQILMVIGSDSLASMRQWHQPEELLGKVVPAVVQRGGEADIDFSVLDGLADADRIELFSQNVIAMPEIELSSSELRSRIAAGKSIRFRLPRSVEAMIAASELYR
ncbi:nicotinate (nicotinamide) nucleotide adenylyltransferase [Planctomycetes bacterium K23_9]|uniref:Probable nicotinate-nucleotide adenylyltransferase n=1 Tax=Stieleria marina TaxID=1930275 RepID=A0A517NNP1_9BACT|nr:Nicotinate-nucleotide adenylyltransferase [Planctomycetes bacterium K23_9]